MKSFPIRIHCSGGSRVTRRIWSRGFFLLACAGLLTTGCAINPNVDLAEMAASRKAVVLEEVPFFPQEKYQCGPAALAGVLQHSGVSIAAEALVPQVYVPEREGALQVEILAATRRAGRVAYVIGRDPGDILAQVEAGRPVLVLQNLRTPSFPVWHYAVVVGFDAEANRFVLNSGTEKWLETSAGKFLRTWNWADRWAMTALRPGQLPASADPLRFMQAVADFEVVAGGESSLPSWQAAAAAWPERSRPHLAMGNLAYYRQDLPRAVQHYLQGFKREPGDPALLNNLASVLGEMGCPQTGQSLLRPVLPELAADSAWRQALEETRAELASSPGQDPARCAALMQR